MSPPYMRLYWGDYHRDTPHLTRSQHGAYLLLLSALWNNGGKLPADDASLARHAHCTAGEWAAMKAVILDFFKVRRGKLTHKRVSAELAKYETTIGKRKAAGKRGSEVTHGKNRASGAAFAKHLPTKPEPEPEGSKGLIDSPLTSRPPPAEARLDGASAEPVSLDEIRERIQREAADMAARKGVA